MFPLEGLDKTPVYERDGRCCLQPEHVAVFNQYDQTTADETPADFYGK